MNTKTLIRLSLLLFVFAFLLDETEVFAESFTYSTVSAPRLVGKKLRPRRRGRRPRRGGKKQVPKVTPQNQENQNEAQQQQQIQTDPQVAGPSTLGAPQLPQQQQAIPTEGVPTQNHFGTPIDTVGPIADPAMTGRPIAAPPVIGPVAAPKTAPVTLAPAKGLLQDAVKISTTNPYVPTTDQKLIAANVNGSPAFQIGIDPKTKRVSATITETSTSKCMAALADYTEGKTPEEWTCSFATAAHCFVNGKTAVPSVQNHTIETADFGVLKNVLVYINERYAKPRIEKSGVYRTADAAVVHFKGEACYRGVAIKKVPKIPVSDIVTNPGQDLIVASHFFPGLYNVKTYQSKTGDPKTSTYCRIADSRLPYLGQGDSGAPIMRKNAEGKLELAGVLSGGEATDPRRPATKGREGGYATNESMAWMKATINDLRPQQVELATASAPSATASLPGTQPGSPAALPSAKNQVALSEPAL